jgi:nitrite reductase (cytochrome c-552)
VAAPSSLLWKASFHSEKSRQYAGLSQATRHLQHRTRSGSILGRPELLAQSPRTIRMASDFMDEKPADYGKIIIEARQMYRNGQFF